MNKKLKYGLGTLLSLFLLTNYTPVAWYLKENYTYANIDNTYTGSEEGGKGFSYETIVARYAVFKSRHPEKDLSDNRLFRTFTVKPWCIWEWHDMIFHSERFWLPYKKS